MNTADFDNMHAALYTINWLDIMEPMNTQEAWEFFKTIFQGIINEYLPITTAVEKKRNIFMSPEALRKNKAEIMKTS